MSLSVCALVVGFDATYKFSMDQKPSYFVPRFHNRVGFERGTVTQIVLRLMSAWPRLRSLSLRVALDYSNDGVDSALELTRRLPLATPNLTELSIQVPQDDDGSLTDTFTRALMPSLHGLKSLVTSAGHVTLDISGGRELSGVGFSALPQLPHLQCFRFEWGRMEDSPELLSKEQVDALVACRSLTELQAGEWIPEERETDVFEKQLSAKGRKQLDDGLVALIEGRKLNGAAPLHKLQLGSPGLVTPSIAQHFLTMTELESITDVQWSCTLTEAHWSRLGLFSRLHTLVICPVQAHWRRRRGVKELDAQDHALLQLDGPLTALQHCPALTSMTLDRYLTVGIAHVALIATLPRLRSLHSVLMPASLAVLTNAPALTHLELTYCGWRDQWPTDCSPVVHRFPLLTSFRLFGHMQMSTSDVARLLSSAAIALPWHRVLGVAGASGGRARARRTGSGSMLTTPCRGDTVHTIDDSSHDSSHGTQHLRLRPLQPGGGCAGQRAAVRSFALTQSNQLRAVASKSASRAMGASMIRSACR